MPPAAAAAAAAAAAPVPAGVADGGGGGRVIALHIEVPSAKGLPTLEHTCVQLEGCGLEMPVVSLPAPGDASQAPSGWLFLSLEAARARAAQEAARAAAEAVQAKGPKGGAKKKDDDAAAAPPAPEPEPTFRLARRCDDMSQGQQLLDDLCSQPLRVTLLRHMEGGGSMPLGVAKVTLRDLIHATGSVAACVPLVWKEEYLAVLRTQAEAAAAQETAAAAAARSAAGENDAGPSAEPTFQFSAPPAGEIEIRVSTAGPIGRLLCPEDLDDWATLTVTLDGCYCLPERLVNAGVPPPKTASGVYAEHPLRYSIRFLGLDFNGGELVMPPPREPSDGDASAAGNPASQRETPVPREPADALGGDGSAASDHSMVERRGFVGVVGQEEFVEGLVRAGFPQAHEDGAVIFAYLDNTSSGSIGPENFGRLNTLGAPGAKPSALLGLRETLLSKFGDLDAAFSGISGDQESLNLDSFREGLGGSGYSGTPEEVDALFTSLQDGEGEVNRIGLKMLHLHKNLADLRLVQKVNEWILRLCGSGQHLVKVVDKDKTGSVSRELWGKALQNLGYTVPSEADLVFNVLDVKQMDALDYKDIMSLESFDLETFANTLTKFHVLITGDFNVSDPHQMFKRLVGDSVECEALGLDEFDAACKQLGSGICSSHSRWLFSLIDTSRSGEVGPNELSVLSSYFCSERYCRIIACRDFVVSAFGSVAAGFETLFDDRSEMFKMAEAEQPCVKWPHPTLSGYRGRDWLQRLLNVMCDERGRNIALKEEGPKALNGGAWLHFFTCATGQKSPADYKDVEPAQAAITKLARWHHGQAFVGLRRLQATDDNACHSSGIGVAGDRGLANFTEEGPEVEFRISLSHAQVFSDVNDSDLPLEPFAKARTYIKGTVRLDRPLARLCPRNIRPMPTVPDAAGESTPLIPPPPGKPPPLSASEGLVLESRRIVGKLASEFARMCVEQGLSEDHIVGPGSALPPQKLLGRLADPDSFYSWLCEQDDGNVYNDLAAKLRPAIVRFVRAEAQEGPPCGLSGNEKDAMYTGIRSMILDHLVRGLNQDVAAEDRRRDACLWQSPGLGDKSSTTESAVEKDLSLQQLIYEYEIIGDRGRATELFEERLRIPENVENGKLWCDYARFLMRTGQRQLQAEKAVCYAISLRPASTGPNLEEAAFLAGILMNISLPCSVCDERVRFEAASSLLLSYVDKHPSERIAWLLLFVIHAAQVSRFKQSAMPISVADVAAGTVNMSLSEAIQIQQQEDCAAEAVKYMELARKLPDEFRKTLGGPPGDSTSNFVEFKALQHRERINRGEIVEVKMARPATPPAWAPETQSIWTTYEDVHKSADPSDAMALQCIDLFLHLGLPNFVEFLFSDAVEPYDFVSPSTAASERCQLQRIRAAMLAEAWSEAEGLIDHLFSSSTDRNLEAYVLLGECRFQAAKNSPPDDRALAIERASDAFQTSLQFDLAPNSRERREHTDILPHLRLATIHFCRAEDSGFQDEKMNALAMEHLKQTLLICPTAEAWRMVGVCAYHEACLKRKRLYAAQGYGVKSIGFGNADDAAGPGGPPDALPLQPSVLFGDTIRFFMEANTLDRQRPQIHAWLAICAAEMGRPQVAKQAIRQMLRYVDRLDASMARQLAFTLLKFSDERTALPGERPQLVQEGRYAKEIAEIARMWLATELVPEGLSQNNEAMKNAGIVRNRMEGEAHYLLGRVYCMLQQHTDAVVELRLAIPLLGDDVSQQEEAFDAARRSAAKVLSDPSWTLLVEKDIQVALELRNQLVRSTDVEDEDE